MKPLKTHFSDIADIANTGVSSVLPFGGGWFLGLLEVLKSMVPGVGRWQLHE